MTENNSFIKLLSKNKKLIGYCLGFLSLITGGGSLYLFYKYSIFRNTEGAALTSVIIGALTYFFPRDYINNKIHFYLRSGYRKDLKDKAKRLDKAALKEFHRGRIIQKSRNIIKVIVSLVALSFILFNTNIGYRIIGSKLEKLFGFSIILVIFVAFIGAVYFAAVFYERKQQDRKNEEEETRSNKL